jgi:hypothetical protein
VSHIHEPDRPLPMSVVGTYRRVLIMVECWSASQRRLDDPLDIAVFPYEPGCRESSFRAGRHDRRPLYNRVRTEPHQAGCDRLTTSRSSCCSYANFLNVCFAIGISPG